MASSDDKTRDLAVLQVLTRLVRETDRIVRFADDIDNYAESEEAKKAFSLIGTEVAHILKAIEASISPLYKLYEIDPGLKSVGVPAKAKPKAIASNKIITAEIISRQEKQ